MRVSKKNRRIAGGESGSISTQRALLQRYAEENFRDYRLIECADDGYSGIGLERPGVKRLLALAREGGLDCVIVKDFSRFSRDYIELGIYTEKIFPFLGIRFIAVNDGYDSGARAEADGLEVPFKQLLCDLYSRDLSLKVRSALEVRRERGQYVGALCPFGYRRDPGDRHSLIIDREEAAIVSRVFELAAEGRTSVEIARIFNGEGIKTPAGFRGSGRAGRGEWSGPAVCRILGNEFYAGSLVYGKYCRTETGGKRKLLPRSRWRVLPGHHSPIVSMELFEAAAAGRRRTADSGSASELRSPDDSGRASGLKNPAEGAGGRRHPLAGRLFCGCGRRLCLKKGLNPYFYCPRIYDVWESDCVRRLNAMFLEQLVLFELHRRLEDKGAEPPESMEGAAGYIKKIVARSGSDIDIFYFTDGIGGQPDNRE